MQRGRKLKEVYMMKRIYIILLFASFSLGDIIGISLSIDITGFFQPTGIYTNSLGFYNTGPGLSWYYHLGTVYP